MDRTELRRFAQAGAQARLDVLQREIDAIVAAFPELRQRRRAAVLIRASVSPSKQRRGMSAANRRAISRAQKKRWAEWRKRQRKND